jgi:hypothetical protein
MCMDKEDLSPLLHRSAIAKRVRARLEPLHIFGLAFIRRILVNGSKLMTK